MPDAAVQLGHAWIDRDMARDELDQLWEGYQRLLAENEQLKAENEQLRAGAA